MTVSGRGVRDRAMTGSDRGDAGVQNSRQGEGLIQSNDCVRERGKG